MASSLPPFAYLQALTPLPAAARAGNTLHSSSHSVEAEMQELIRSRSGQVGLPEPKSRVQV